MLDNFSMLGGAAKILAENLYQCPQLEGLDLSNSRNLEVAGIEAIAAGLRNCTKLEELHLNSCEIDSEGARTLSLYLKHYTNLRYLTLRNNKIDKAGVKALTSSSKKIDLCNNTEKA